jgi:hypothetical protein
VVCFERDQEGEEAKQADDGEEHLAPHSVS